MKLIVAEIQQIMPAIEKADLKRLIKNLREKTPLEPDQQALPTEFLEKMGKLCWKKDGLTKILEKLYEDKVFE